jgi:hypothetical protein
VEPPFPIPGDETDTVVVPAVLAVSLPELSMVATVWFDEIQILTAVGRSTPSENVMVPVYDAMLPTDTIVGPSTWPTVLTLATVGVLHPPMAATANAPAQMILRTRYTDCLAAEFNKKGHWPGPVF